MEDDPELFSHSERRSRRINDRTASELLNLDNRAITIVAERENERGVITKAALADMRKHLTRQPTQADVKKAVKNAMIAISINRQHSAKFGIISRALSQKRDIGVISEDDDEDKDDTIHAKATVFDEELEDKLEVIAENIAENELEQEEKNAVFNVIEGLLLLGVLFSLYFPDIWDYSNLSEEYDKFRDTGLLLVFMIFLTEIIVFSCYETGYFGSLFFILDAFGTCSMILEWTWLLHHIHNNGDAPAILRATRVTKLAVRSKEIFKLFANTTRILRLFRPFLKYIQRQSDEKIESTTAATATTAKHHRDRLLYTSEQLKVLDRVEAKTREVNEAFAFRVAGACMILTICIPFLQPNRIDYSPTAWISTLKVFAKDNTTTNTQIEQLFTKMRHFYTPKTIQLRSIFYESPYLNTTYWIQFDETKLRHDCFEEYKSYYTIPNAVLLTSENPNVMSYIDTPSCATCSTTFFVTIGLDITEEIQREAGFAMVTTTLVVLVIFFGTSLMTHICSDMLIVPLTDALLFHEEEVLFAEKHHHHKHHQHHHHHSSEHEGHENEDAAAVLEKGTHAPQSQSQHSFMSTKSSATAASFSQKVFSYFQQPSHTSHSHYHHKVVAYQ